MLGPMQARAFKGTDVVRCLHHLLRHLGDQRLLIWDGAPIHRDTAGKGCLAAGAAEQISVEQLPGYAPALNPDEGVWN